MEDWKNKLLKQKHVAQNKIKYNPNLTQIGISSSSWACIFSIYFLLIP